MDDRTLAIDGAPAAAFGRLSIRSLMFMLVLVVLLPAIAPWRCCPRWPECRSPSRTT